MNDQQGRGPQGDEFEDIRILGLDSPDDDVEPGRSVFGGESAADELPHWTEPPAVDATGGASDDEDAITLSLLAAGKVSGGLWESA